MSLYALLLAVMVVGLDVAAAEVNRRDRHSAPMKQLPIPLSTFKLGACMCSASAEVNRSASRPVQDDQRKPRRYQPKLYSMSGSRSPTGMGDGCEKMVGGPPSNLDSSSSESIDGDNMKSHIHMLHKPSAISFGHSMITGQDHLSSHEMMFGGGGDLKSSMSGVGGVGAGGMSMMANSAAAAAAYHHQTQLIGGGIGGGGGGAGLVGGFGSPIGSRPLITTGVGNGDHHSHLQQIAAGHPADPSLLHDYHSL